MKRLLPRSFLLVSVCSVAALGLACDSAIPTAPAGTILTISANPSQISLNGSSTITVVGRKPNGSPLNEGTEILFSTDRGTLSPTVVTVDEGGVARATLRGDGRAGTANVEARVSTAAGGGEGGGGTGAATVAVQIGVDPLERPQLLVTVTPNTLFVTETAEVTIIARNSDGSPASAGQTILLTTTLGAVQPDRPKTRADGTASSTFLAGTQGGTATVTAILGSSEAATAQVTIQDRPVRLSLQANRTTIPDATSTIEFKALVTNAQSQGVGQRPVEFSSTKGVFSEGAVVLTSTQGIAENTLTVDGSEVAPGDTFTVTVTTAAGEDTLTDSVTITVVQ
jgi:hypothetical protein